MYARCNHESRRLSTVLRLMGAPSIIAAFLGCTTAGCTIGQPPVGGVPVALRGLYVADHGLARERVPVVSVTVAGMAGEHSALVDTGFSATVTPASRKTRTLVQRDGRQTALTLPVGGVVVGFSIDSVELVSEPDDECFDFLVGVETLTLIGSTLFDFSTRKVYFLDAPATFSDPNRAHPVASLSMSNAIATKDPHDLRPFLQANINGEAALLLVDTGTDALLSLRPGRLNSAKTDISEQDVRTVEVMLGVQSLPNGRISARIDTPCYVPNWRESPIDGVLGIRWLRQYSMVEFDWNARVIRLWK